MVRRDRRRFLPPHARESASADLPISIGRGQTNSQPSTVADMMMLLAVEPGHHVLDVGAGSGWSTAILADLVGPTGSVIATELVPELTDRARAVLDQEKIPWAVLHGADPERLGWPDGAPYDRILVSAMARHLPDSLVDQLAPGGIIVIPVAGTMVRAVRDGDSLHVTEHGGYRFVPLMGT